MFTRIALAVFAGVLTLHLGAFFFYAHEQTITGARTFGESLAERAVTLERLTAAEPELLTTISAGSLTVERSVAPPPPPERPWPHEAEIREPVLSRLAELGVVGGRFHIRARGADMARPVMQLSVPARNGWFTLEAEANPRAWQSGAGAAAWMSLLSLMILGAVLWGTRRVTRRLPQFIEAAEHLGTEQRVTPLAEEGPAEIRRLSAAFNRMQHRVKAHVDERSAMLAAVSHDLRTFVTRVKLRTDYIDDDTQRAKAQGDLDAITQILNEAVAFARDEQSDETRAPVDLASMLTALVDDERDLGNDATYEGPPHLRCFGQPTALNRAFANLIKNAVRYGGSVTVRATEQGQKALVDICDPGPGIPPEKHDAVLKPYVRLEPSRNRSSGGAGLGLAITANVLRRHAGTLKFVNQASGFTVRVLLPTAAAGAASLVALPGAPRPVPGAQSTRSSSG